MEKSKAKEILTIALIILIPFVGSASFTNPWLGDVNVIDEGQLAAWANHMMHGKLMYKDIYITYGPFYVYPLFLIFKFIGFEFVYLRFFYLAMGSSLGLIATYLLIKKLDLTAKVFYPLLAFLLLVPGMSLRQGVVTLSIYSIYNMVTKKTDKWFFAAGFLLALSFLITFEAGVLTGSILGAVMLYSLLFEKDLKSALFRSIIVLGGFLSLFGTFSLWALYEGWFVNYVHTTIDVAKSFSGVDLPNGKAFPNVLTSLQSSRSLFDSLRIIVSKDMLLVGEFILFTTSFIYLSYRKIANCFNRYDLILLMMTGIGLLQYYSLVGRSGNFFLALTPAAILIAYFVDRTMVRRKKLLTKRPRIIVLALTVLLSIRIIYIFWPSIFNLHNLQSKSFTMPIERLGKVAVTNSQYEYFNLISKYVKNNTTRNDYIFFLSNEPFLYFLTDRVNPTRFDLPYIAHTKEKRFELLSDLKSKKPNLIFYDTLSWPVDEVDNKRRLPEILRFINRYYIRETIDNGRVEVYILKDEK